MSVTSCRLVLNHSMLRAGLAVLANVGGIAVAGPQLPVPCVAAACGTTVKGFVSSGAASAVASGSTLAVSQTSATATLNWSSFNIGAGGTVNFKQPASTSIALNRIFDTNPSSIFGTLKANGQIYLINANGFVFGSGSVVNVGGLLASSLNLTDANFSAGILTPALAGKSALQPFVDASGNVISQNITVQTGAQLTAADGGRLLLAAPNVSNSGSLTAPDGQIILAAGQSLYLQASGQPDLRGLVVEVDGGGTAANQLAGSMSAPRGNVTLTGLMVNQDGRVSATTSVNANGSIVLQAADTLPSDYTNGTVFSAARGGTVELGRGSVTEVLPEYTDTTTAVAAQTQLASQVNILGQQVYLHGATIDAPSGNLTVTATESAYTVPAAAPPSATSPPNPPSSIASPSTQIRVDAGTTIDLAGSDAVLPMSANLISVQLRSNEFADDPTQRGGALQSTPTNTVTVTVDVRADGGKGTPIADVAAAIAGIGQTIAQRTEAGGKATFQSDGDVVFSPGASINVSGGYTTYLAGTIQTTKLVGSNGQLYDIGSANPLLNYSGVINPTFTETYNKWGVQDVVPTPGLSQFQSSYVQGANAGSIQFAAPSLALAGTLQATTVSGLYQRTAPPAGGTLTIGEPVATATVNDYLAPSVSFAATPTPIAVADGAALPSSTLQLPTAYLTSDGFTNTTIYSATNIALPAGLPLTLSPGASLSLIAPRIDVDSSITAVAGSLSFENVASSVFPVPTSTVAVPYTQRLGIGIGSGVTLDVSGQWTNDGMPASGIGAAPILQNAGSIALKLTVPQSELVLGDDVALRANGGAWLQSGGALSYGTGGGITLDASPAQGALQFGENQTLQAFGTGTAAGGAFTLLAPRIAISQGLGSAWTEAQRVDDLTSTTGPVLSLYAPLFSDEGFSSIKLTATGATESYATTDVLAVASGTTVNAQTSTLQLNPGYVSQPTGTALGGFTQVNLLPLYERPATSVSLNVARQTDDDLLLDSHYGTLDIQAGASILTGPLGSIALSGEGGVTVSGTLRAPGGAIQISIPTPGQADPNDSSGLTDPGYVPTLGIDLKPTAVLDVSAATLMTPNNQGLVTGSVLPGGSVALTANRGTVVAETGSLIDIAGGSALLDVANASVFAGSTRETVASAAGSLTVSSPEAISLLGTLQAQAGVGTSGSAAAGSLEVDLQRGGNTVSDNQNSVPFPNGTLEIQLVNSTAGDLPGSPASNLAVLGVTQLEASGIDALTLRAGGIATASGVSPHAGDIQIDAAQLILARQLVLDAPSITVQAAAALSAPYVELGNSVANASTGTVVPAPIMGSGSLTVTAEQLTLLGNFALQGAANVTLRIAGDVQLEGTTSNVASGPTTGSIVTGGSLTIDALRIYPDTYTDFSITSVKGGGGTVSFGSVGASPGAPLSADGSLFVSADNISVSGTLYAPFGSINLAANTALSLASGSLISVSGAGLDVPFGATELNQGEWVYTTSGANAITGVPTKQISLTAPNVAIQAGATANITGGGDLYAYEWVPGTGGSYDNLNAVCCATAGNTALSSIPNLYAIFPAARGQAGPFDPQESARTVPGQTIYLSGGAGVAAGFYALLPPRYALAAGAVLIQLEPSVSSAGTGQIGALANGTPLSAGYLSIGTTGLHTGGSTEYEGVAIYPTGYADKLAAYTISQASSYFGNLAATAGTGPVAEPADAGTFTLQVTPAAANALNVAGSVLTAAASGGRGAEINVSAPNLEITAGNGTAAEGAVALSAGVLQGWNASAITLGGVSIPLAPTTVSTATTTVSTDNTAIAVAANTVTVDSGVQLTADQIELVAQQSITLQAGASLQSTSGKTGTPLKTPPALSNVTLTDTSVQPNASFQAALLGVSDLTLPLVCRSAACLGAGINAPVATAMPPANATIALQGGSSVSSGGALAFDAPGDMTLAGMLNGKGASWSLSSGSIAFVGSGTAPDTLNIGSGVLAALQQAGAVRLTSQGNIDIDSGVSLGVNAAGTAPTLSALTLIGNAINNASGANATFGGSSLFLGGIAVPDATNPPAAAAAGAATLSFVANNVTLGSGVLAVSGFGQTTVQAAGPVQTQGAGYLNVGGNVTINAAELTPAPDAADAPGTTLAASGTLTLGAPVAASAGTALPKLIGGSLTLTANGIDDAGVIVAPSGVVDLVSSAGLHLGPTASITTAGTTVTAVTQSAASPGGLVMLTAGGDLALDSGSSISVAGSASAPAGSVMLTAPTGTMTLAGSLDGAAAGNTGGTLDINAGVLAGGLGSLLTNPGLPGFSNAVNVRAHSGDLDVSAGQALAANSVTLTADTGTIDVAGLVSAPSAAERGLITLSGGAGVTLESTAQLHADGSGAGGRGGEIDLNAVAANCTALGCAPTGSILLDSGSLITTNGMSAMGELVLRAPALTGSNDVAINVGTQGLGANVSQVGQIIIEPVLASSTSAASVGTDLPNAVTNALGFLSAAAPTIAARLTAASANPPVVQAGVELQDTNAGEVLSLPAQTLDFAANSNGGQVVNLAVMAAGGLGINGTMSDGFIASGTTGTTLSKTLSGSLTFVAGADLASADPLAVLPVMPGSAAAALVLGPQAVVRTGTGDINLAAAGDIDLLYGAAGGGASVYTAGLAGTDAVTLGRGKGFQNFPTAGGNVQLRAGEDINGAPLVDVQPDGGNYSVTGWLIRGVTKGASVAAASTGNYGINFDTFHWNVGALGGGDVSITAGGKVSNLSAAAASSSPDGATVYGGGGGLRVTSVGDVGSAQVYVGDGIGSVTTASGLTPLLEYSLSTPPAPVGSSFALGNAQIDVWARQSVQIDAVYNPTYVPTGINVAAATNGFFTYGATSALAVSSTDGEVAFNIAPANGPMGVLVGPQLVSQQGSAGFQALPANLSLQALQQDVNVDAAAILFPSATGQLNLFAGRDILGNGEPLSVSDSAAVPTAADASVGLATITQGVAGLALFQGVIHTGDTQPVLITAGRDIDDLYVRIPKAGEVSAGRDLVNLSYQGQNVAATDATVVTVGRDLEYLTTNTDGSPAVFGPVGIAVGGPGSLDIFAGRNVNLGIGPGILTTGNLANPELPSAQGADLTLAVGYGTQNADNASFLTKIIDPSGAYQSQLVSFVESQTGAAALTYAQAKTAFDAFSAPQQTALIDDVFFNELLLSGRAANSGTGVGFSEGYAAINALYPGSRDTTAASPDPYSGSLNLISSQIYTLSGGNISILVPGGAIDVGLAFTPVGVAQKQPGSLGIVAEGPGNIDIYSAGDVNVNASRIFTLGGGNILIWSDQGSIDAGNGAKSSLSVPPPTVEINPDGSVTINYSGSLSGSGIRTVQTDPSVAAGNVDLDAPVGTVNAGDAGIGAAGNINIAAAHVIGALNINFGGTATGVPSDLSGLAASLSGASAVGSSATTSSTNSVADAGEAAKETTPLAQTALSWLEVFVTGLGEENCKQDDIECLKRQKSTAP